MSIIPSPKAEAYYLSTMTLEAQMRNYLFHKFILPTHSKNENSCLEKQTENLS